MKLLFDENLSPKLPRLLAGLFPESKHVRECELLGFPDIDVWEYARINGFTSVSKDSDFQQRSVLYGLPPKLVWLRIGNCTTRKVVELVRSHQVTIHSLESNPLETVLVLS